MTDAEIEEAAKKYAKNDVGLGRIDDYSYVRRLEQIAFISGARWAREEAEKTVEEIGRELKNPPGGCLITCADIAKEIRGEK